jgi:hypothetical protein
MREEKEIRKMLEILRKKSNELEITDKLLSEVCSKILTLEWILNERITPWID